MRNDFTHIIHPTKGRFMFFNMEADVEGDIVNTGNWVPALLDYAMAVGTKLVVQFVDFDQRGSLRPNPSFMWADASGITAMYFEGSIEDLLGIRIRNSAKLAKRLKEIVRVTRHYTAFKPRMKRLVTTEANEMFFDGMSLVRRSFATSMRVPSHVKRVSLRFMGPQGSGKGDGTIISDEQMDRIHGDFDIVTPYVNIKSELATNGWYFTTMNPHHDHNQAMFDVQSASWLREWLFPRKQLMSTLSTIVNTVMEGLRDGEWPNWMIHSEEYHNDDITSIAKAESISETYNRFFMRWQMHGMKLEHSSAIMGMAANLFGNRLQARLDKYDMEGNWKPMMWYPLAHAFYGHVMTHEFLKLAGFEIPAGAEDKVFYHEETGSVSLPGYIFAETFEDHGTWDLDDSAKFLHRTDENGNDLVVIVRSPNSDGEYSVHEFFGELPTYHNYGEVPVINMAKAPLRIAEVQAGQKVAGMPRNNTVYDANYTMDDAKAMIALQENNPNVGGVANAMMVYYASTGKSPAKVLASMGDIVDCVQQTPHENGFSAIDAFTKGLWKQVVDHGRVDWYMHLTRVPKTKKDRIATYDGYFTALFRHYQNEVKRYRKTVKPIPFHTRAKNPIEELKALTLDLGVGAAWINHAEAKFEAHDKMFPGRDKTSKAIKVMKNREIIRTMVAKLNTMSDHDANMTVLAMYRYATIMGTGHNTYGVSDRAIFMPLDDGETTVMDIFIRALMSIGVAKEASINEKISMEELVLSLLSE